MIGLLLTGGLYAAFAPATAETTGDRRRAGGKGRELFLVGCAFCHGQNGEGILTRDGTSSSVRPWSESVPPPSISRSAPAGCPR